MATPITLLAAGGIPMSQTTLGSPFTPQAAGGLPVTLIPNGGAPVALVNADGSPWFSAHLNFVARQYYWNGAGRTSAEFATFTGAVFGANGLICDGVALNIDVTVAWASINLSFPCAMIASFTPTLAAGNQVAASIDIDTSNNALIGTSGANGWVFIDTVNVNQVNSTAAGAVSATRITVGGNIATNNVLQSINGAIGAAADTSATLFSPTTLRIAERPGDTNPLTGTIHHVILVSGAQTQAELNTLTMAVHALPIA